MDKAILILLILYVFGVIALFVWNDSVEVKNSNRINVDGLVYVTCKVDDEKQNN